MRRLPLVLLLVLVVLILFGQTVAYYGPDRDPAIRTEVSGDTVSYTVDVRVPSQCTELHLTGTDNLERFYVYYDTDYPVASESMSLESAYFFLEKTFGLCSNVSVDVRDASGIRELIDSGSHDFGLIFTSGTMPDTIYDGTLSSPVVQWLLSGGYVIWSGDLFGRNLSTLDEMVELPGYYTEIAEPLFGEGCTYNDSDDQTFGDERINGYFTGAAGFYYANTTYGFDTSTLSVPYLEAGYTDGIYSSITTMRIGSGTLCHFGDYAAAQESGYLAHAAIMGITAYTEVDSFSTDSARFYGHTSSFEDSADLKHLVILHDIGWFRVWTYDRTEEKFV